MYLVCGKFVLMALAYIIGNTCRASIYGNVLDWWAQVGLKVSLSETTPSRLSDKPVPVCGGGAYNTKQTVHVCWGEPTTPSRLSMYVVGEHTTPSRVSIHVGGGAYNTK